MDFMGGILSKYKELSSISGNSKNEVETQKELYKQIQKDLQLVKKKYDYYLASQYNGGIEDKDRKSTRLNSSHANISYAVFCLKKKKSLIVFLISASYLH